MSDSLLPESHERVFERFLRKVLSGLCEKNRLRDACEYALAEGGRRVRPTMVLLTADALGARDLPLDAALSVEFFHSASLIADDLPCMDNDDRRRGKPSVHKVFGETTALLASYALITAAFEMIHKSAVRANDKIGMMALLCAAKGAGISGATGGQFLDLFPAGDSWEEISDVIRKKTATLFEVSLVFGWLFGGGSPSRLEEVKRAAYHFGMAFQIADDRKDRVSDLSRDRRSNATVCWGTEGAKRLLEEHLGAFERIMRALRIMTPEFGRVADLVRRGWRFGFPAPQ
ncbi:MAG: polyprenyl synthetase family protein [Simkaniaceae bacterium]|nr:polyprenyl synthetase family protein [Simkaniaceae bacterium]